MAQRGRSEAKGKEGGGGEPEIGSVAGGGSETRSTEEGVGGSGQLDNGQLVQEQDSRDTPQLQRH